MKNKTIIIVSCLFAAFLVGSLQNSSMKKDHLDIGYAKEYNDFSSSQADPLEQAGKFKLVRFLAIAVYELVSIATHEAAAIDSQVSLDQLVASNMNSLD
ncbi:hypothetical protein ACFQ1M_14745 [Sungkyunkwania multivorans]|uniref:Uncharacterized protein n=1 Tax=Sungkyunkwania multivorans TaxID=1173618 RepID=A0ABW3D111_9FLAO